MQTIFDNNRAIAVEGALAGFPRQSRPFTLAQLEQQSRITIADSEAGDLVITVVDDESLQSYSLTVAVSGTTEATTLDEMVAAWQINAKLNDLFSVSEDGATLFDIVSRHGNRAYTITTVPPGSMTAVVSEIQAPGGSGIEFGRMVQRGAADDDMIALDAATSVDNLVGVLFRQDGNHFHATLETAVDVADVARTYSVMRQGTFYAQVEDAVTPASRVFVRRAQTSGAGALGRFRAAADGTAQLITATPTAANDTEFVLQIHFTAGPAKGETHSIQMVSDGSGTATEICDGLRTSLNSNARLAALITDTGTATLLLTASDVASEFEVEDIGAGAWTSITETTARDDDTIEVSAFCQFESTAAAGALARVRVDVL